MFEAYCDAFFKNVLINNLFGAIPEVIICFFEFDSLVMFSLVVCFVPINHETIFIEVLASVAVVVVATVAGTSIVFCEKPTDDNNNITNTRIILMLFEVVFVVVFISFVVTLFVHDKSMATTQPREIVSITNPKTRSNYKKAKFEVFRLKKVHFTDSIKQQKG